MQQSLRTALSLLVLCRCCALSVTPPPRRRAAFYKAALAAAGVSTSNVFETEELARLYDALPNTEGGTISLPMRFWQGGAYAQVDAAPGGGVLQLLIDSGAATTLISSSVGAALGIDPPAGRTALRSTREPRLALPCTVASPQQAMPSGVDGILGVDSLRRFAAVTLDWASSTLMLHSTLADLSSSTDSSAAAGAPTCVEMPMEMRRVSAGELPFVAAAFGSSSDEKLRCELEALVDTGSPVTMCTPELAAQSGMAGSSDPNDDIMTTGVDGQPTRMRASRCEVLALGSSSATRVAHFDAICYAGSCPMMVAVGWTGMPAALLGLDVLRGGVKAGQPPAAAAGGPKMGALTLDFERRWLVVRA